MHTIEHNVETGEIKEVEMTAEEVAAFEARAQEIADTVAAIAEAETVKAAEKQAILDQLGITAEQAKLLLS
jgi:hypothetical protein